MKARTVMLAAAAAALAAGAAGAGMVVERWGAAGAVQHPRTLVYELHGDAGRLMRFDLSALAGRLGKAGGREPAKVYRARLFFAGGQRHRSGFDIVPARREGRDGKPVTLKETGRALALAPPYHRWFDATEAVRGWVKAQQAEGLLWVRRPGRVWSIVSQAGSAEGLRWARIAAGLAL